ncbi:MAG: VOC family protein [Bacillota bacterium]|nr:VOC family protein [Bacillota bacterium]
MIIKQVLTRIYVHDINRAIEFYEGLFHKKCNSRFNYQEVNLELAQVENILILCGCEKSLEPFRNTKATFLVDSVAEFRDYLLKHDAIIIRDLKRVPTGANMTVKHADGTIVEYVEHD